MNFPTKLKSLRKEKGLTQEELASAIHVSRTLISKYENGAVEPTRENAELLAQFFGIKLSELLDQDDVAHLALKRSDAGEITNRVINILAVIISVISTILAFVPCVIVREYIYNGEPGCLPAVSYINFSPLEITLSNGNPFVLIYLIVAIATIVLGLLCLFLPKYKWLRITSYIIFGISVFLLLAAIISVISCASSNLYDYL